MLSQKSRFRLGDLGPARAGTALTPASSTPRPEGRRRIPPPERGGHQGLSRPGYRLRQQASRWLPTRRGWCAPSPPAGGRGGCGRRVGGRRAASCRRWPAPAAVAAARGRGGRRGRVRPAKGPSAGRHMESARAGEHRRFSIPADRRGVHWERQGSWPGCGPDVAPYAVLQRRTESSGGWSSTKRCRTTPRAVQPGRYLAVGAPSSPDAWSPPARAFSRSAAS